MTLFVDRADLSLLRKKTAIPIYDISPNPHLSASPFGPSQFGRWSFVGGFFHNG